MTLSSRQKKHLQFMPHELSVISSNFTLIFSLCSLDVIVFTKFSKSCIISGDSLKYLINLIALSVSLNKSKIKFNFSEVLSFITFVLSFSIVVLVGKPSDDE